VSIKTANRELAISWDSLRWPGFKKYSNTQPTVKSRKTTKAHTTGIGKLRASRQTIHVAKTIRPAAASKTNPNCHHAETGKIGWSS
jgi:hypothetical protein